MGQWVGLIAVMVTVAGVRAQNLMHGMCLWGNSCDRKCKDEFEEAICGICQFEFWKDYRPACFCYNPG